MKGRTQRSQIVIIGGGLAGLMAAANAETLGLEGIVLVDIGVAGIPRGLGGFAQFSGAKFSLFPAGSGIGPMVGGDVGLIRRYSEICMQFAALGFPEFEVSDDQIAGREVGLSDSLSYRSYHSILLTPRRMEMLIGSLSTRLKKTRIIRAAATRLSLLSGPPFHVHLNSEKVLTADGIVVAAGRLGSNLLKAAGVTETRGKGIDLGVRLGFDTRAPLAPLRELGPDAKFMAEGVRTFCLNSPGRIFHYPGLGFNLPGGVVAEPGWPQANVGVLCRVDDRHAVLRRIESLSHSDTIPPMCQEGSGTDLGWSDRSRSVLGDDVAAKIDTFVEKLAGSGLIDLPSSFAVHYPLMDWHWPVFSLTGRLATSVPGVMAAGDASGHARGLLQAALMGWLAVEELVI